MLFMFKSNMSCQVNNFDSRNLVIYGLSQYGVCSQLVYNGTRSAYWTFATFVIWGQANKKGTLNMIFSVTYYLELH
jgi:hypothetical protein